MTKKYLATIIELFQTKDKLWVAAFKTEQDQENADYCFSHPNKNFLLKFIDDLMKKSNGKNLVNNPIEENYPDLEKNLKGFKTDTQIKICINPEFQEKHSEILKHYLD